MNQQKNFILFLVLSTLILISFQSFFAPPPPQQAQPQPPLSAPAVEKNEKPTLVEGERFALQSEAATPNAEPKTVVIESDLYRAELTNVGACLVRFTLKRYHNRETGEPMELIHPLGSIKPFTLQAEGDTTKYIYHVKGLKSEQIRLTAEHPRQEIWMEAQTHSGLRITEHFVFTHGRYDIGWELVLKQEKKGIQPARLWRLEWPAWLGPEESLGTHSYASGYRLVTHRGSEIETDKPKKTPASVEYPPPIHYSAVANQFFTSVLIPDVSAGPLTVRVVRDTHPWAPPKSKGKQQVLDEDYFLPRPVLLFSSPSLERGEVFRRKINVFLGPQEYDLLKSYGMELEKIVDFGMFEFLCIGMLKLLRWFYHWSGNWGIAILLLSIFIKLLLWWPTHSSYRNMSLMQRKIKEIQPKMEAIKRKYANDRQKQQQETMKLYQTMGVNPAAGCLPMVLQIPVFFALYTTLVHAIELRGAPFVLWVQDLSLKDPYYVLPLVMGATMFWQQKVNGSTAASSGQQKFLLWFMPVFLTFISFQFPSGLLLYWIVTNILSVFQQKLAYRSLRKITAGGSS